MRPCSPDAQQAFGFAQSTVSKLPVPSGSHECPASKLMLLPLGPTAIAVWPLTHAAPERYSSGASFTSCHVLPPSEVTANASGDDVGSRKSPPTAIPCCWSRNASAKMPALGPLWIGVALTSHVWPRSSERKTRACAPPPVANQAVCPCSETRHCPLAANANSPGSAGGISVSTTLHVRPPSSVARIRKKPPTGSESARPRLRSKNVMQS